jgi:cytochrome b subunit of formate dehydrogenase
MKTHEKGDLYIKRFGPSRIVEHWLNALVFVILVLTGLSQKFHDAGLSQLIIGVLGGIDSVRVIHRITGVGLATLTLLHIISATYGVLFRRWQPTMVIGKKDFTDVIENLKYYFGLTDHPARCDRYDYKQKFEYWGVVVGGILMTMTGLTLWFPTIVARFLPGGAIPVAKALHTNEALLAFLVIVIWHIYNSIFSPEVFPMDTAIFTGKISRDRMVHEHPVELARMEGVPLEAIVGHREEPVGMGLEEEPSTSGG